MIKLKEEINVKILENYGFKHKINPDEKFEFYIFHTNGKKRYKPNACYISCEICNYYNPPKKAIFIHFGNLKFTYNNIKAVKEDFKYIKKTYKAIKNKLSELLKNGIIEVE